MPVTIAEYAHSGHFGAATFENWESEFLQMGIYVLLTVRLRQRGSAESRRFGEEDRTAVEDGPPPWPVRKGGVWRHLYANSLSLACILLFAVSFALPLLGSWELAVAEALIAGRAPLTLAEHLLAAQFWFESLHNWQSEFLSVLALVVLSIWLRQEHSPQSKPVAAPHGQTGV